MNAAGLEIPVKITPGGIERQDSVRIALSLISAEAEIVIVHDAARPFATASDVRSVYRDGGPRRRCDRRDSGRRYAQAGCEGDDRATAHARWALWQAQTPQAFQRATA